MSVAEDVDVFSAWLNHPDGPDGDFNSDLHVWCSASWPKTQEEYESIYDILNEEEDCLD